MKIWNYFQNKNGTETENNLGELKFGIKIEIISEWKLFTITDKSAVIEVSQAHFNPYMT